jgi:DNA-binding response OmpR family regulator
MRVLVVEDSLLVAEVIAETLHDYGWDVVGPASRVQQALALLEAEALDGAVLDVNLAGQPCFPIAAALTERGVPFVFLTGYSDAAALPLEYRAVPRVGKPFDASELYDVLSDHFGVRSHAR